MTPNKTKSGLFETPRVKITTTPATPRSSKVGSGKVPSRSDQTSTTTTTTASGGGTIQSSRLSIDRLPIKNSHHSVNSRPSSTDHSPLLSPRSVESKSDRRPTKTTIARDLKHPRTTKESERQEELNVAHEDLKKAKEQLAFAEKEKTRVIEELNEAKKRAYDASEKLTEALAAQKQTEECIEIEKFRTVEIEQAAIVEAHQKEEAWGKELERIRSEHAIDASALLSTTQELERVKHELVMTLEAKNAATAHADEALNIAEVNAEKVSALSGEISNLKALLDSKLESKDHETAEQIRKMNSEMEVLRGELEKAKETEKRLVVMEHLVEGLRAEVAEAKKSELHLGNIAEDWKKKTQLLETKVEEAIRSERSATESLASAVKKLEESNASLHNAESEIANLKGKVESLQMEITRQKEDLDESDNCIKLAKAEVVELESSVEVLKSELRNMEERKLLALDKEKRTASDLQSLLEEKNKLLHELKISKEEVEKSKAAMDGLASALQEVQSESRDSQQKLSEKEGELSDVKKKIIELQHALKTTNERYEAALGEAKNEIIHLKASIEASETESCDSKSERGIKENDFVSFLKKSEEEITSLKDEMESVSNKLKTVELEATVAKEEGIQTLDRLKVAELEAFSANEAAKEAKAENLRMKESLLDKENELQGIAQENADLRSREETALKKIEELYALLEEVTNKKIEENGELSSIERDYDIVSKASESPDVASSKLEEQKHEDLEGEDSKPKALEGNVKAVHEEEELDEEMNKWENCKIVDKGISPPRDVEQEVIDEDDDEASSKAGSENFDHANGLHTEKSEDVQKSLNNDHQHKKKSPLLRKFGKFLKKKSNHK